MAQGGPQFGGPGMFSPQQSQSLSAFSPAAMNQMSGLYGNPYLAQQMYGNMLNTPYWGQTGQTGVASGALQYPWFGNYGATSPQQFTDQMRQGQIQNTEAQALYGPDGQGQPNVSNIIQQVNQRNQQNAANRYNPNTGMIGAPGQQSGPLTAGGYTGAQPSMQPMQQGGRK